jgi:biopolymer transport protein ExbD
MIDEILQSRKKKHVKDLNIVPILDMLTTVIFFLLMSTSFMEYTKLTLPPASTVSAPVESTTPPVAPKLLIKLAANGQYQAKLIWGGRRPGSEVIVANSEEMVKKITEVLQNFKNKYNNEKTLQLSLARSVPYQELIHAMDAARESLPDVVLSSYQEAETL